VQIQRFDQRSQIGPSSVAVRRQAGSADLAGSSAVSRESELSGAAGNGELEQLERQLGDIDEIRPDVVAAARLKVQRGDYLTRTAADQTAAAILSKDAWTGFQ
jgi:hypothetical protein